MKRSFVVLERIDDPIQAELLRGLLEAQGILVSLSQEGAARALGISLGPFGEIELLVPDDQLDAATLVLEAYYRGDFRDDDFTDSTSSANPED